MWRHCLTIELPNTEAILIRSRRQTKSRQASWISSGVSQPGDHDGSVWTLGTETDVQAIYERLENWEEGTGDRFYDEVLTAVRLLLSFPRIGPLVHRGKVRRVLVFNRNYGLFYIAEDRGLVIHALLDLRQDPETIISRVKRM